MKKRIVDSRPSKRLKKAAWDFLAPMLLAAVVVGGASAAGTGDYALIGPDDEVICAKTLEDCRAAQEAIRRAWLTGWPKPNRCEPHPGCFDARSVCIPGYRGARAEAYCR